VGESEFFFKDVLEHSGTINEPGTLAWKVCLQP